METNGTLKHTTTCRLPKSEEDQTPCGFTITDHPLNVQIIGQADRRLENFVQALMKHLAKKHPETFKSITGMGEYFFGWLALQQFQTPDPAIRQSLTNFAMQLRNMVRLVPVQDSEIESAAANIGFTMEDIKRGPVIQAMKNIRNYYEGTLQRPAETPPEAQKPLVTL